MQASLDILFGALLTVVTATALGTLLMRALSITLCRVEERLLGFVTGAACLSGCMFILCAFHLVHNAVLLAGASLVIGAAIRFGVHRPAPLALPAFSRMWKWIFGAIFAPFTVLYFFNAMAPEHSPDGSAYHLVAVADYLRAHGFVRVTTNMYANLPQGLELLFLFGYAFGRHSAAALIHCAFLMALPGLMLCYARRFGITVAGATAAIFVFASPVVGVDGSSAYVDVAVAAVLFALYYFLQIWMASPDNNRLLAPIGILAGFSFAIKITAILALPYAIGLMGWTLWRARKPFLRPALAVTGIGLLFVLPWLIKNWLWIGNPVTPFANRLFPNPYVHISFEETYRRDMRTYRLNGYKQIPYELTVLGSVLNGLLGPLFLLAPIALLALRTRAGRQLLLAAAVFGAPYFSNIGTRFLIPALPFLSLAMAVSLMRLPSVLAMLALAHALASWPSVLTRYCSLYAWHLEGRIPLKAALRIESEDSYLRRKSFDYVMNRMLEENVPAGETIFSMGQGGASYTSRRVVLKFQAASNEVLSDILLTPLYPDYQPGRILAFEFPERIATRLRVLQIAQSEDSMWAISELRIYNSGREVPRAPGWRLTAQPNPWDVQLAFDDDPVTRWRSWQTSSPGMHVDVDFGGAQKLDAVRIETSPDWQDSQVRLQAMDSGGNWMWVSGAPVERPHQMLPDLRRAATAEFKARGVRYLLVGPNDFGATDFQQHPEAWGIRLLADKGFARLYQIE